jgi:hypothetical protein
LLLERFNRNCSTAKRAGRLVLLKLSNHDACR